MRWWCAVVSLALAACLDAPPSSTGHDAGDSDGGLLGGTFSFGGLSAQGALSLDGRDELVLIGQRDGAPVAVLLSAVGPVAEDVIARPVELPFDPVDLVITRWGSLTGLAVVISADGDALAIDQDGAPVVLPVHLDEEPADLPFRLVSAINDGGHRLLLADDEDIYVSLPLGTAVPGDQPLEVVHLTDAAGPLEIIVYDQVGRIACVDLVEAELVSCGTAGLGASLTASGASTSGRPGW
jgi:hypothetical protein